MRHGRSTACLAALAAFIVVLVAAVAAVPYALGLLSGCIPPEGSCSDSVGWAMIISEPVTVPIALVVAGAFAAFAYRAVMRDRGPS